jgi:hypothetical protein
VPSGDAKIVPPTEAVVVDPGDHVVPLGMLSVSERKTLDAELAASAPATTTTSSPSTTTTTIAINSAPTTQTPLARTGLNVTGCSSLHLESCLRVRSLSSDRAVRPRGDLDSTGSISSRKLLKPLISGERGHPCRPNVLRGWAS